MAARRPLDQSPRQLACGHAGLASLWYLTITREVLIVESMSWRDGVGGHTIAYERVGEGPPLVFVHGAAVDSRMWEPQLAGLADEFTVVAWDEPGAGRSSDVPGGFGLAVFADTLAALLEALGLGPAHVAGLSWGGTVVLELYRRRPGLVATLIMIDTYAGWKGVTARNRGEHESPGSARCCPTAGGVRSQPPGLFADQPPEKFAPLRTAIAADVRPATLELELAIMADDGSDGSAIAGRCPDSADLGRTRCALAAARRAPVRGCDFGFDARGDRRRRPYEQSSSGRSW